MILALSLKEHTHNFATTSSLHVEVDLEDVPDTFGTGQVYWRLSNVFVSKVCHKLTGAQGRARVGRNPLLKDILHIQHNSVLQSIFIFLTDEQRVLGL